MAAVQAQNYPFLYVQDLILGVLTDDTLQVTAGRCRDSSNSFDIIVPNALTLDFTTNGANGLDTGSIAATKMYYIYALFDQSANNLPAVIASLAVPSVGPLMPFGYSNVRYIGAWPTDGSADLYAGTYTGRNSEKTFSYATPRATSVTAGKATSYAGVDLSQIVPALEDINLNLSLQYIPNAASDTLKIGTPTSLYDVLAIVGQVASVASVTQLSMQSDLLAGAPTISYVVSTATGASAAAIKVLGFDCSL